MSFEEAKQFWDTVGADYVALDDVEVGDVFTLENHHGDTCIRQLMKVADKWEVDGNTQIRLERAELDEEPKYVIVAGERK